MKKFKGSISTNIHGSDCEFEFEVEDDATEDDIEHIARECAFDLIEWSFWPVPEEQEKEKADV